MPAAIIDDKLKEGYCCPISYFRVRHNNKFGLYILLTSPIRDVQDYTIKAVGEVVPIFKGSDILDKVTKASLKEVMLNRLTYDL